MAADDRGLITLAVGDRRFLEMAVDLALSARDYGALPVALAADAELARHARTAYAGVFDHVCEVEPRFLHGRAAKYGVASASPFERAIYLDADCILLGSLDRYWQDFGEADVALVGGMHGPDTGEVHHGFPVGDLMRRFGLDRYLKCNSGVFYLRKSGATQVMDACLACYEDEILPQLVGGFLGDELALGVVGGRWPLSVFPDPQPMHWRPELATLDPTRPTKPVCHLIGPVPRAAFGKLLAGIEARRKAAGLPTSSLAAWRWKHRRVARALRLARWTKPLLPLARVLRLRATRHW